MVDRLVDPEHAEDADVAIRMVDFETGQSNLRGEHKRWLATVAMPAIARSKDCHVHLTGYASKLGSATQNMSLSHDRMDIVLKTLSDMGHDAFHKNVVNVRKLDALGDTDYKAKNTDNSAFERAVEVQIFLNRPQPPKPSPRPSPPPGPAPAPPVNLEQDIWVQFNGTNNPADEGTRDESAERAKTDFFNHTPGYRDKHLPLKAFIFTGSQSGSQALLELVLLNFVVKIRKAAKGKTIVIGASVGGPNARNLAVNLTKLRNHVGQLSFIGIIDGAFFERNDDIVSLEPLSIRAGEIFSAEKWNYFQVFGQEIFRDGKKFPEGTELHGPIPGFTNVQLDSKEIADPGVMAVVNDYNRQTFHTQGRKEQAASSAHTNAVSRGLHDFRDKATAILLKPN